MDIHFDNRGIETKPDADVASVVGPFLQRVADAAPVVMDSEDPEGPHQVRVGLRKSRTALKVFGRRDDAAPALQEEAREIAAIVGRLRDLDVVRLEIVAPFLPEHPGASGFEALNLGLLQAARPARAEVRAMIAAGRLDALQEDLRGWAAQHGGQRAAPLADKALKKRFRKAQGHGWRFAVLDIHSRHEFRKDLKKLRYTLDCGAWADGGEARNRFVKRLKRIQLSLGAMNDAVVAADVLGRLARTSGTPCRAAAGQIVATLAARSAADVRRTAQLWTKVEAAAPDWI